jgi:hypothetical protein
MARAAAVNVLGTLAGLGTRRVGAQVKSLGVAHTAMAIQKWAQMTVKYHEPGGAKFTGVKTRKVQM